MNHSFRTEPEAAVELEHAALWYERQRPGLGIEFLAPIDTTLDRIDRWPLAASRVAGVGILCSVVTGPVTTIWS